MRWEYSAKEPSKLENQRTLLELLTEDLHQIRQEPCFRGYSAKRPIRGNPSDFPNLHKTESFFK